MQSAELFYNKFCCMNRIFILSLSLILATQFKKNNEKLALTQVEQRLLQATGQRRQVTDVQVWAGRAA